MPSATARKRPSRSTVPGRKPEPLSDWGRLQDFIRRDALDAAMWDFHPEIPEAMALLKHATPDDGRILAAALRLLIDATVKVARDYQYIEPTLMEPCNLLHDHLSGTLKLVPGDGQWKPDPDREGRGPKECEKPRKENTR